MTKYDMIDAALGWLVLTEEEYNDKGYLDRSDKLVLAEVLEDHWNHLNKDDKRIYKELVGPENYKDTERKYSRK
jgi:hypothetical protein